MTTDLKKTNSASITPYNQLPEAIREWFVSNEVYGAFLEAESRVVAGADKIRVIPDAIHDLVTGEIAPGEFVPRLQEGFGAPEAAVIAAATILKEKVLNPIAAPLKLIGDIDISVLPGKNPEPKTKRPEELEPLIASPAQNKAPIQPGMALPSLRPQAGQRAMNDVAAPKVPAALKRATPEPKIMAAAKPFMLHEEKPVAPTETAGIHVDKNFTFDPGTTPISKITPRPAAAQLNSSFDSMLAVGKPAAPGTAKTAELPKIVHYTSMKTKLDENGKPLAN